MSRVSDALQSFVSNYSARSRHFFIQYAVPACLTVIIVVYMSAPLRSAAYPTIFEDDFFYYIVAAKHIVTHQGSTFDGIHMTNGYHPLWMVVSVAMVALFDGRMLFIAFAALISALILWGYGSVVACLRPYTNLLAAQSIAAILALNLLLIQGGMEVALAVPLLFFLCRYRLRQFVWRPGSGLIYGLLAAAVVLARLDCALFIILLAVLDLLLSSEVAWRTRLGTAAPFVLGMTPVVCYLAFNQIVFHSAMPVSSHAKEMRFHHSFARLPIRAVLMYFKPEGSTLIYPTFLLLAIALVLLVFAGTGKIARDHRGVVWALLVFMPVHLALISFTSDWQVWSWYLYPFLACGLGSAIVLLSREESSFQRRYAYAGILTGLLFIFQGIQISLFNLPYYADKHNRHDSVFFAAQDIKQFAVLHPGIYAMGDRSGMVAYYLPDPLMQTEGLMMDKPYLENIRAQRDLVSVLRAYHVRYFIATDGIFDKGCWLVREPRRAGPDVPVMRGSFCFEPVHTYGAVDHARDAIFDLGLD